MTADEESKLYADLFISAILSTKGLDYSVHKDVIAEDINDYVFNGNWDHTIDIDDVNLPDIRVIEENEYDQSMDDDEKPSWDKVIEVRGYYLFID